MDFIFTCHNTNLIDEIVAVVHSAVVRVCERRFSALKRAHSVVENYGVTETWGPGSNGGWGRRASSVAHAIDMCTPKICKNSALGYDRSRDSNSVIYNSVHTCPLCSTARIAPVKTPILTSGPHHKLICVHACVLCILMFCGCVRHAYARVKNIHLRHKYVTDQRYFQGVMPRFFWNGPRTRT